MSGTGREKRTKPSEISWNPCLVQPNSPQEDWLGLRFKCWVFPIFVQMQYFGRSRVEFCGFATMEYRNCVALRTCTSHQISAAGAVLRRVTCRIRGRHRALKNCALILWQVQKFAGSRVEIRVRRSTLEGGDFVSGAAL